MNRENATTFHELSEEEQARHKSINDRGDFVEKNAVEDLEVAHRIALLENEAFGELQESIQRSGITVEEIIAKLGGTKLGYDDRRKLQDLLFQHADLQRMRGHSIDSQIAEPLKTAHAHLAYSEIMTKKLCDGVTPGDVKVIGEILKDAKILYAWQVLGKLENDEQRSAAFAICKTRIDAACSLLGQVEDTDAALAMYTEVIGLASKESYSDTFNIENAGKRLSEKLFATGARHQLVDLIESGTFQISYYEKFLHLFGTDQQVILDMVKKSHSAEDDMVALKFVSDPELIAQLTADAETFPALAEEDRTRVAEYAHTVAQALNTEPEVYGLSELDVDARGDFGTAMEAKNKFVVGITSERYIIAWSNVKRREYHRQIFEDLPPVSGKSGGYISMVEANGTVNIRMLRSSSDYGCYSREVLEHFRVPIEDALRRALEKKPFTLEIDTSK